MKSKVIAVLAVLALALCPLFMMMNSDNTEAEVTNDIDGIMQSNDYWVTAEKKQDKSGGYFVTIIYNGEGKEPLDRLNLTSVLDISTIEFIGNFIIPTGKTVCICDNDVSFTSLRIEGTLTSENSAKGKLTSEEGATLVLAKSKDNGTNGQMSGVNVNIKCILTNEADPNNNEACDITAVGIVFLNDSTLGKLLFFMNGNITVNQATKRIAIAFDESLTVVNEGAANGEIYITYCEFNPRITELWNVRYIVSGSEADASGFIFSSENNEITLSGKMTGGQFIYEYKSIETNAESDETDFYFEDLSLSLMTMDFRDENVGDLYFSSGSGVVDYSKETVTFRLLKDPTTSKQIKSADESTKVLLTAILGDGPDETTVEFNDTVNNTGAVGYGLKLIGDEGIKKISKSTSFVEKGKAIDLTKITVTPKDGYDFVGWFYKDPSGKLVEVPAGFIPTSDMELYAVSEEVEPGPVPEPSGSNSIDAIAVILAMLVIVILGAAGYVIFTAPRQ